MKYETENVAKVCGKKDEEKLKENNTMWVQFICQMSATMRYNVTLRGFYDALSYSTSNFSQKKKKKKTPDIVWSA